MTSESATPTDPVNVPGHKRRSPLLTRKFLVFFLVIATILGGGFALLSPQEKASAAVDDGKSFSFPSDLDEMTGFWTVKAWPLDKKASQEAHNNITGFIYRGGAYGDRDGQLTAYIRANFPNAVAPSFNEYDIDFRPTRRTPRNARRIVRDSANGFLFYTDDHYANFHMYGYMGLPDTDEEAGSLPSSSTTIDNALAPVSEETAGDPPAGGDGGNAPDPNTFLPIEDPAFEDVNNATLGQADERGDALYSNLDRISLNIDRFLGGIADFLLFFEGDQKADLFFKNDEL